MQDIETVEDVDIERFMGDWYVLAHIPPSLTKKAYNAVERYRRGDDGRIEVLYTFNRDGFDGELKTMTPTGFVDEEDPAQWGMRLVWPFKADYRIAWLDPDYRTTIIARNRRDYAWIMARRPIVEESVYVELVDRLEAMGYDLDRLRKVPQQPLAERQEPAVASEFYG